MQVKGVIDGNSVTTEFFGSWSGLSLPPTPRKAMSLEAAHTRGAYYSGTFEIVSGVRRLKLFSAFELEKKVVIGYQIPVEDQSSRFFKVGSWNDGQPTSLTPLSPSGVLAESDYLFHTNTDAVNQTLTRIIRKRTSRREYIYDASGSCTNFVSHNVK